MKRGGLFITGTGTEVGKTTVTALLGALLQRSGYDLGLFKPVHTGVRGRHCPDLEMYSRFITLTDAEREIIPLRFREPQAPTIAAEMEKKQVQIEKVLRTFYILRKRHANLLIEGIGGVEVPVSKDYRVRDLIRRFALPALVVARPDLGTINHTCLTVRALRHDGLVVAGIVFSNIPPGGRKTFRLVEREIVRLTRCPVLGRVPRFNPAAPVTRIVHAARQWFDMTGIRTYFIK